MVASYAAGTNYTAGSNSTTFAITPAMLLVSATGVNKVYDGGTTAVVTLSDNHLGSDVVTTAYTSANFAGKNVGTARPVSVSGISITGGADASNYTLNGVTTASTTANITAKTVTAAIVGNPTKTYDGNQNATLTSAHFSLSGVVGSESFTVTKTTGTYDSANVMSATTVSTTLASGDFIAGGGASASNYTLPTTASGAGHITQATSTTNVVGNVFTYSGATFAGGSSTVSGAGVIDAAGATISYSGDRVNVGTFIVTATFAGDANHTGSSGSATSFIGKADATIAVTPYSVTYNGAAHTATGTATGVLSESLGGLVLSSTAHTNAGDYSADAWTFTDVTGNYNNASGTVSDSIAKASATIVVTPYSVTYNGVAHTASGTATGGPNESLSGLDLSGTTHTSAGTTTDTWTFTDVTGNYNNASGMVHDSIAKADATLAVTPYGVTCNGAAQTATGTAKGVLNESLSGLDLSGTTHTNAGDYPADAWIFTDVTGNYNSAGGTVHDSIAKADATIVVTPYSVTFNGAAHTASGTATGVLSESLGGLVLSGTTHTNAGDYPADAWTFTDVTGNFNNASGAVHDSITKADATIAVMPYSVTYNGAAHTASGTATGVLNESLSGLDLSGTTHTSAGTTTDTWTFTDVTGNYNNASGTVSDSIAKANATIVVTPYSVTYNGAAHTATGAATSVLNESLSGLVLSGTTHTNAGDYPADAWTFTDVTGNYNNASGTVHDSIAKADAMIVVTPYSVSYNGAAHTATGAATGVLSESLSGLVLIGTTRTNAGDYPADAWIFTDVTGNYNSAGGTVHDSIAKANATIVVTPYSVTYNGTAHTASGTAKGVLSESLSGLDLSGTTHTNAGTTTDTWTFTDVTGNYNNASGTVHDSIAKADATIAVTPYSVTYNGTAHTATGTATGVLNESLSGLDLSGTTHTNAGTTTDTWTFTDVTGNYNNASGTVHDSIAKADATIVVTPYSFTYNGAAHTASVTATGVLNESLGGLVLSGTTHTNAGDYPADAWTFTDVTGNYNNASGTVSDSIAKADATIAVTPYSVTYNGAAHTATGTATGVLSESLGGLVLSGTTHTNAGDYPADAWTFTDVTGNYNNASGTVHDSIAKADATLVVTPYSVTYNGAAHTASGTATGVLNESLSGLVLSGTTHANAGTYATDPWTFTDVTGNYNNASGTVSDSIAKATLTVTTDSKYKTYGTVFAAFTGLLTGVVAGDGITTSSFSSAGAPAGAAVGAYTIAATLNDPGGKLANYTISSNYGTLTVGSISGFTYVLDSSAGAAVTLSGNASLAVPSGGVLMVDSTSSSAITASGNAKITLGTGSSIQLPAGGGVSKSGNAIVPAFTVSGSTADPLASLTAPTWSGTGTAVNVTGNSTLTINPGVYSSIKVAGNGVLNLNAGLYIIAGAGLSVTGNGSLNGTGVTIYNGGNAGTYGGIALSGNGTFHLTAPGATGTYPGTVIFQDRNNTRALSFSGNALAGTSGTIYAKNALLALTGNASNSLSPLVVGSLNISGNGTSSLTMDGVGNNAGVNAGELLAADLYLYVSDPSGYLGGDVLTRLADTIANLDALLAPYNVVVTQVSDPTIANLVLDVSTTSAAGGYADGVLGCYSNTGEITLIQGWNWYTGAETRAIGADQYDFETIVTHEMGHALGLGHSTDTASTMHATLAPGEARRMLTTADLNIRDADDGSADGLHAALPNASAVAPRTAETDPGSLPLSQNGFAHLVNISASTVVTAGLMPLPGANLQLSVVSVVGGQRSSGSGQLVGQTVRGAVARARGQRLRPMGGRDWCGGRFRFVRSRTGRRRGSPARPGGARNNQRPGVLLGCHHRPACA